MRQNANVLLSEMAGASAAVAGTSSRLAKIEVLAKALHDAGPAEVTIAVAYLSGELPQRQIGVGWATLKDAAPPADQPSLTLTDVDAAFTAIGSVSGTGSVATRKQLVDALLGRATAHEQAFLFRLLSGELRQGALEGIMAGAIARAAQVRGADVRRALMLSGSMATVAQTALAEGSAGLRRPRPPGRAADRADARLQRPGHRGRACADQPGCGGVEDGRHPDPGAYPRRKRPAVHANAGRDHRSSSRGDEGPGRAARPRRRPGR